MGNAVLERSFSFFKDVFLDKRTFPRNRRLIHEALTSGLCMTVIQHSRYRNSKRRIYYVIFSNVSVIPFTNLKMIESLNVSSVIGQYIISAS